MIQDKVIGVIGLGYVGLPLALAFGKVKQTIGFDINQKRIQQLNHKIDTTGEVEKKDFDLANLISFTTCKDDLKKANIYIITVPTPVDNNNEPDLSLIDEATAMVASLISHGDIIIYESTVYPGVTEDFCKPIIERISGLKFNIDFFLGYSPERINPGDNSKKIQDITKVVSGSTKDSLETIYNLYDEIINAGIFRAKSIKVAEAAKVIENTQRDVNIGLINELSRIFNKMDIDTREVLNAAKTKWNFLPFEPGLVGGHCIGVDPYYIAFKAKELEVDPDVILSARKINDFMPKHIVNILNTMITRTFNESDINILLLGLTFKEDCPDFRNSKSVVLAKEMFNLNFQVQLSDEKIDSEQFKLETGFEISNEFSEKKYHAIILAVPHKYLKEKDIGFYKSLLKENGLFFDLKSIFPKEDSAFRL